MKKFALALTAALSLAGIASAQPLHLQPGSALIFPLFDSQPQSTTILNVTNTSEDRTVDPADGFRAGDVLLHYVYYGKLADGSSVCLEFDRFEFLTPADTLTVLASRHNPEGEVGFLTVTATDPETGIPIAFDNLIGSAYVANAALNVLWSYTPYAFEATTIVDDDVMTFDGTEYSAFPECIMIDSFFEEDAGVFDNKLTLMSTSGQDYINELDVFTWNNKEDRFSRTFKFVCHTTVALSEISSVVRSLGGDADEFAKETGWMKLQGRSVLDLSGNLTSLNAPGILGVFVQIVRTDFTAGHALHYNDVPAATVTIPVQL